MLCKHNPILLYLTANPHKINRLFLIRVFACTIVYQKIMIDFERMIQ